MRTTKKLPKRTNANSGKKAHNDNKSLKVGRIYMNSWATEVLAVRDIVIYESELVHIYNRHKKELRTIGMTAFDFVRFIVNNFNEIYRGTGNSFLLVVRREHTSNMAAIELHRTVVNHKEVYKINTVAPIKTKQLCLKELLCANDH